MGEMNKNEANWEAYSKLRAVLLGQDYIRVPAGINPYNYDDSCGLSQIFKFGYMQAKRGRPCETPNFTDAAKEAFELGYNVANNNPL